MQVDFQKLRRLEQARRDVYAAYVKERSSLLESNSRKNKLWDEFKRADADLRNAISLDAERYLLDQAERAERLEGELQEARQDAQMLAEAALHCYHNHDHVLDAAEWDVLESTVTAFTNRPWRDDAQSPPAEGEKS